ncbi:hypothetical protein ACFC36_16020 [Streptomyces rubiginosohelvolus]|uniref:hypothetical protein n=1 Tax=Streptomyces rubiginosohelvolus TaxID=67362 RepID=UPI0035DF56CD
MANTPKAFYRSALPTGMTTVYTVPPSGVAIITNIVATNPAASAASVTVRLGGVPLLSNVGVAPGGVLALDVRQVLSAGDKIDVQGNATPALVHISGVEVA